MESLIFPCIRRVIIEVGDKYSTKTLYDSLCDVKLGKVFDSFLFSGNYDTFSEAECKIVIVLSNSLVKIMNGENQTVDLIKLIKTELGVVD
jgi:hypothetical protein